MRSLAPALDARQRARRAAARDRAGADTRRAFLTIAIAGGLAVLAALALATLLIGVLRRPLDQLVHATRRVAGGDLEPRLDPDGPRELRELGESFNAMASDLDAAGRALEAERERLAVTVESLGDALVSCDADGVVTAVNPRAEELVGALQPGVRADGPARRCRRSKSRSPPRSSSNTTAARLAITAAPLGAGEEAGTVWTVRDVSERARLDRLKSEFVATASHELRSPLTSIKGFAELLAHSDGLNEREREFAEMILLSADRMVELANDLLDVASVEAGQIQLRRRPLDIGGAVEEVAALMRPRFEASGQRLEVDVAPGLPRALADAARVRQIITNLLTNAHLYTGEGGRVLVAVEADDAFVSLVVSDTGRGMTAEEVQQVFVRFYRGGDGGGPSGTGLGLSIVRSLVDLHGGTIDVDSEPGRGTTFRVRLPSALEPEPGADAAEAIRGKRVLVVDDEPAIADLIVAQLAPFDVDAVTVHSGEAAMERLRVEAFDAVTLDILMPGMSGFEVLRAIRSDATLNQLPGGDRVGLHGRAGAALRVGGVQADRRRRADLRARIGRARGPRARPGRRPSRDASPARARARTDGHRLQVGDQRHGGCARVRDASLRGGARRRRSPERATGAARDRPARATARALGGRVRDRGRRSRAGQAGPRAGAVRRGRAGDPAGARTRGRRVRLSARGGEHDRT